MPPQNRIQSITLPLGTAAAFYGALWTGVVPLPQATAAASIPPERFHAVELKVERTATQVEVMQVQMDRMARQLDRVARKHDRAGVPENVRGALIPEGRPEGG